MFDLSEKRFVHNSTAQQCVASCEGVVLVDGSDVCGMHVSDCVQIVNS